MRTSRPAPDPGLGATIELTGGKPGRLVDLVGISKALACKCLSSEQAPPPLNEPKVTQVLSLGFDSYCLG
jgi:hypothetical protein